MREYLELVELVLTRGKRRCTSTQGIGNIVYPGHMLRFRPAEAFPLLTTKSLRSSWKAIVVELLWFLSGSSRVEDLHRHGVHIWDQWATKEICDRYSLPEGDLGPIYGPQWRAYRAWDGRSIDQVTRLIEEIKVFPDSKRMMVDSWNPADVDRVMVAPCHGTPWKCIVAEGELNLLMVQRSCDLLVGVPFNIASYSLLFLMLAQVTGLKPGEFIHFLMDIHIYDNQVDGAREQLTREPRPLPRVILNPAVTDLFSFTLDDFTLEGYTPHPYIRIPVAL